MTNDETRMTKQIRITNDQAPMTKRKRQATTIGHWSLVIGHYRRRKSQLCTQPIRSKAVRARASTA